jgi:hypothetical protein
MHTQGYIIIILKYPFHNPEYISKIFILKVEYVLKIV